jgi:hypothetical protein
MQSRNEKNELKKQCAVTVCTLDGRRLSVQDLTNPALAQRLDGKPLRRSHQLALAVGQVSGQIIVLACPSVFGYSLGNFSPEDVVCINDYRQSELLVARQTPRNELVEDIAAIKAGKWSPVVVILPSGKMIDAEPHQLEIFEAVAKEQEGWL